MYKSANEQIHAPTDALNRVLSEAPKMPRRTFAAVKICAAAAAAIAVAVSSAYFFGTDTADEPVRIMQADTNTDAEIKKDVNTEKASDAISAPKANEENEKNTERIYSVPAYSAEKASEPPKVSAPDEKEAKITELPKNTEEILPQSEEPDYAASEAAPESAEAPNMLLSGTAEKCVDAAGENDILVYAADNAISENSVANSGSGARSTTVSAVSYEEYCEKIGYDVISKAVLPEGVSIAKPAEVYIDEKQNSNTFYTTSENSKECYITLSVNKSSAKDCTVSAAESGYDISVETGNISISAVAYEFTEEEANTLAKSLSE